LEPSKVWQDTSTRQSEILLSKKVCRPNKRRNRRINHSVEETTRRILGSDNYEKWLVLAALHKLDSEEQLVKEFKKYNVKVFFLRDILKEIINEIKGTARDHTGRFIQLLASQLRNEAKENLTNIQK